MNKIYLKRPFKFKFMKKFKFDKDVLGNVLSFLNPIEITYCLYIDFFFYKTICDYLAFTYKFNNINIEELVCPNCASWIIQNIKNTNPIVDQLISNNENTKILCETCDKFFYNDNDHNFFKYKGTRNYISLTIYTNDGNIFPILYYKNQNGKNLWEKYNIENIYYNDYNDYNDYNT